MLNQILYCFILIPTSFLDEERSIEDDFFSVLDFSDTFDGVLLTGVEYSFSGALYGGTFDILGGLFVPYVYFEKLSDRLGRLLPIFG